MSPRAAAVVEVIRSALAATEGLEPGEQELVVTAIVAHLRSSYPTAIAPLDSGFSALRDPDGGR